MPKVDVNLEIQKTHPFLEILHHGKDGDQLSLLCSRRQNGFLVRGCSAISQFVTIEGDIKNVTGFNPMAEYGCLECSRVGKPA
ncbi:MAG: hypothetical protein WAV41_02740 [Microgenomates group bacterium]